jgi:hypothetical protein
MNKLILIIRVSVCSSAFLLVLTLLILPKTLIKRVHADSCNPVLCGNNNPLCNQDNCQCEEAFGFGIPEDTFTCGGGAPSE